MDEEIKALQEQLAILKENEKQGQTGLANLMATPLLSELRCEIGKLEEENVSLSTRLAGVQDDGGNKISPQQKVDARKEWKTWQKHARLRSQIYRNLWHKCLEVLPEGMGREEFWEYLGLEGPIIK